MTSLALVGYLLLGESQALRTLLKPGSPMSLTRALSISPIGMLDASVAGAVLAQLMKDFIGAVDVMDFDAVREFVRKRYELDLDQDLLARLGGGFGISLAIKVDSLNAAFTAVALREDTVLSRLDRLAVSERTQEILKSAHQGAT